MRVDAHQHFWHYDPVEFGWISDEMAACRRDFLPGDLVPHLAEAGIQGTVAVQARCSDAENEFLLGLGSPVLGVVGWVDLTSADVDDQLARWAGSPRFKGVREIAQGQAAGFLLRPSFVAGVNKLRNHGLTYDLLVYANQLEESCAFADLVSTPMVLDHCAKPDIRSGMWEPWASQIRELARREHVWCKVSGLAFEADWATWDAVTLRPYIEHVLSCFGPKRCMVGSDWPVCLPAGDYGRVMAALESCLSSAEREAVMGLNAARFYGLGQ